MDTFKVAHEIQEKINKKILEVIEDNSVLVSDMKRISINVEKGKNDFNEKYIIKFDEKEIGIVEVAINFGFLSITKNT